jgi:DNA-binding response OmpR family regulator
MTKGTSMATEQQNKGRVLVVEDERPVRELLVKLLHGEGYEVQSAASFTQVQQRMAQESFELVTLDIVMPEVTGLEVLSWLRRQVPDTGVVMVTALGEVEMVIEAMRQGAYSYILKPFHLELVVAEVGRAMERQQLVAQNRAYQLGLEAKVAEQTQALRQAYERLEQQVKELQARDRLTRLQMEGSACQEYEELLQVFREALAVEHAVLYRPDPSGRQLAPVATLGEGADPVPPIEAGQDQGLVARGFRERQPQDGAAEGTVVPLLHRDEVLGILWVMLPEAAAQSREERLNTLWRLGQQAALALWTAQVGDELAKGDVSVDQLLKLE